MAIICDVCKADVTPIMDYCDDIHGYEMLQLNGRKVCLCIDCYSALSNYVESKEFLDVVKRYKQEMEYD